MAATGSDDRATSQLGAPEGNLVLDVYVLNQRIGALLDTALASTGVTPAEYAVYSQLGSGPLTPGELSARLGVRRSTLSGHLATLDRRGHTRRLTQEQDKRSYRLELTTTGERQLERCRPMFRRARTTLEAYLDVHLAQARLTVAAIDRAAVAALSQVRSDVP
jgi:DNA-binding MarR family transcriptional regulator